MITEQCRKELHKVKSAKEQKLNSSNMARLMINLIFILYLLDKYTAI